MRTSIWVPHSNNQTNKHGEENAQPTSRVPRCPRGARPASLAQDNTRYRLRANYPSTAETGGAPYYGGCKPADVKAGVANAILVKEGDPDSIIFEFTKTEAKDGALFFKVENFPVRADGGFNASSLMPKGSAFRTYTGSLTTPPLSSGVSWFVMDEPIEASKEQIETLRKAMGHNTNRSIQGRLGPLGAVRE